MDRAIACNGMTIQVVSCIDHILVLNHHVILIVLKNFRRKNKIPLISSSCNNFFHFNAVFDKILAI